MTIATNKALIDLIPNLASENFQERQLSAISLALYSDKAVPLLIMALGDDKYEVRETASQALSLIGSDKVVTLVRQAYLDEANSPFKRAWALSTLARTQSRDPYYPNLSYGEVYSYAEQELARNHFGDEKEIYYHAIRSFGYLKDKNAVPLLKEELKKYKGNDHYTTADIIRSLGQIGGLDSESTDLIKEILKSTHETALLKMKVAEEEAKVEGKGVLLVDEEFDPGKETVEEKGRHLYLVDEYKETRIEALRALISSDQEQVWETFKVIMQDDINKDVRDAASDAWRLRGNEPFSTEFV